MLLQIRLVILFLAASKFSTLEIKELNTSFATAYICSDFHVDFVVVSLLSQDILTDLQNTTSLSMSSPWWIYLAMRSPCRQSGCMLEGFEMLPLIPVTALKFVSSSKPNMILIHCLKLSPKSTSKIMPGKLFCIAEWNESYVFLSGKYAFCSAPIVSYLTLVADSNLWRVYSRVSSLQLAIYLLSLDPLGISAIYLRIELWEVAFLKYLMNSSKENLFSIKP